MDNIFSSFLRNKIVPKLKKFSYLLICKNSIIRNLYLSWKFASINKNFVINKRKTLAIVWQDRFNFLIDKLEDNSEFNVLIFPRLVLNIGFNCFLKKYNKSIANLPLGEYCLDFYRSDSFKKERNSYIKYCKSIIYFLKKKYNVTCFLIPKLNDPWSLDLIKAINSSNLKLIVDDREGISTPKRLEVLPSRLSNLDIKFDLLTAQNNMHKDIFARAGFPKEKVIVNGSIQSDYWENKDFWKSIEQIDNRIDPSLIKILFFAFGEKNYLNYFYKNEERNWSKLSKDINDVLFQILEKYEGNVQIIYKFSDKKHRDKSVYFERFKNRCKKHIEKNYLIVLGGSTLSYDLMRHSNIIVGFQTSALIEAMNTDRTILYTAWGDLYESIKDTLLPIARKGCVIECSSKEYFFRNISQSIENFMKNKKQESFSLEHRKEFVDQYFSKSDGLVAERLSKLISKIIN